MEPFERTKHLNIKRAEWRNIVSGYDGDNDRQLRELHKSAYIRNCGPGLPVKIAFDYTAFEKDAKYSKGGIEVMMMSNTLASVLPITLMSLKAWEKYESRKQKLPEFADFYKDSKKFITSVRII